MTGKVQAIRADTFDEFWERLVRMNPGEFNLDMKPEIVATARYVARQAWSAGWAFRDRGRAEDARDAN